MCHRSDKGQGAVVMRFGGPLLDPKVVLVLSIFIEAAVAPQCSGAPFSQACPCQGHSRLQWASDGFGSVLACMLSQAVRVSDCDTVSVHGQAGFRIQCWSFNTHVAVMT
jgi:hypothetical protein